MTTKHSQGATHPVPPNDGEPDGAYIAFAAGLLQEMWKTIEGNKDAPEEVKTAGTSGVIDSWFERYGGDVLFRSFKALVEGIQPVIGLCALKAIGDSLGEAGEDVPDGAADLIAAALG